MLTIWAEATAEMAASRAYRHPLLDAMRSDLSTQDTARQFAVQWYKAATAHKKSFPGLVYNVKNDEVRLGLIDILYEEYGFGELDKVHARLLEGFLEALGLSAEDANAANSADGVAYFSHHVDECWLKADADFAYGVHYALEFLAANMHKAFYANVARLGLSEEAICYFKLHSTVEEEHAEKAHKGLTILANNEQAIERLSAGMKRGTHLVEVLLDGLQQAYDKKLH
jgi:pyrroloquinoline quinone (PQQ) biosynthesis protein C